jgi:predicted Ser/Thr protein kinase
MKGGKPCGLAPYDSPPRYAPNAFNRRKFAGPPWNGKIPACDKRKTTPRRSPPTRKRSPVKSTQARKRSPVKKTPTVRRKSPVKKTPIAEDSTEDDDDSNFALKVVKYGKELGRGKESVVYLYGGKAVKVFDDYTTRNKIIDNIEFLKQGKNSGVVPIIYNYSISGGWIEMENLSGYVALGNDVKSKSKTYRASLLRALITARKELKNNVEYRDMRKLDNIAARHDKNGMVIDVKFYEGGKMVKYTDQLRGQQYIKDMASDLKVTNFCKTNTYCKHIKI